MKDWWHEQSARDRRILLFGSIFLGIALTYLLLWEPLHTQQRRYHQQISEQQQLLSWMQRSSAEAKSLLHASGTARPAASGTLLSMVDKEARSAGLGKGLKRVEPSGKDQVRLWFDGVDFNRLITWLGGIEKKFGSQLDSAVIDRTDTVGRVNARMVISR